jgi:hypothetical protein
MRDQISTYQDAIGVIGRDMYRISGSDPRWVAELLNGVLDDNAFYTTRAWGARYKTMKNLNILLDALDNTGSVTNAEKNGYAGFAKTLFANELLALIVAHNESGVRIDVRDPENLGPIVSADVAYAEAARLLDEGASDLSSAGDAFEFTLTSGFAGFDTPAGLRKVNRALAARVATYRGRFADVQSLLNESFLDLAGDINTGAYMTFSTSAGDLTSPLFLPQNNTGEIRLAHPSFVADAEAGDVRAGKASMRSAPAGSTGLSSNFDVWLYQSNVDPVPIIRNEELMLISAEAKIQQNDLPGAVADINAVRAKAGLAGYAGPMTKDALIDQMLHERRYSLWCEGHRWADMRRYDKLNELPLDRAGDLVHTSLPVPRDDQF